MRQRLLGLACGCIQVGDRNAGPAGRLGQRAVEQLRVTQRQLRAAGEELTGQRVRDAREQRSRTHVLPGRRTDPVGFRARRERGGDRPQIGRASWRERVLMSV